MNTTRTTKETKERHLTVARKWFTRTHRNIEAPEIRLAGVYLHNLGFTIGSKVTVIEEPGKIIVRLDEMANYDPEETANDRRLARKIKKIADYQKSGHRPLSHDHISQYLNGKMDLGMSNLITMLIDGEICEPYRSWLFELLDAPPRPGGIATMCDTLWSHINQVPVKDRKKRAAKETNAIENTPPVRDTV